MKRISGFPPIAHTGARVLVLGSMPSRESLARQHYYAHPRNAFWPIVTSLLEIEAGDYAGRAEAVAARGLAVWDVLHDCVRPGSLDSDIDEATAVVNDFERFFRDHPRIRRVFFNGAKAESIYRKRVLPGLGEGPAALPLKRLPSTSPAHAGMSFDDKKTAWRAILGDALE